MYKIYKNKNDIYAVTKYHGKNIKAKASCDPRDTFNEEIGVALAKKRCQLKVVEKRADFANEQLSKATDELARAQRDVNKKLAYLINANKEVDKIKNELKEILSKI